jgi:hypothetical protein
MEKQADEVVTFEEIKEKVKQKPLEIVPVPISKRKTTRDKND